jgi:hypothetical protein
MKFKIISMLFIFVLLISAARAEVAEKTMIAPSYYGGYGTNQYYSVVFDGEGEASVIAKLKFMNNGNEPIKNLKLEIPGKSVRVINIVQEGYETKKQCSNWQNTCIEYDERDGCKRYEQKCLNWDYYPGWPPVYYTLEGSRDVLSKSVIYDIELEKEVNEQESGAIIIYYKADGYVDKSVGIYDFDFETIKWKFDTQSTRVSINVQEDFYLNGGETKIDYMPFSFMESAKMAGAESQEMSDFSRRVEYQSGYVKTASELDPWESFHVKGEYAGSWFWLHKALILGIILVAAGVIGSAIILARRIKFRSVPLKVALSGFATTAGLGILWLLSFLIIKYLAGGMSYHYRDLFALFIVFISVIMSLVILFGPAIYMGTKYGVMAGLFAVVSTVVWLFLIALLIGIFLGVSNPPVYLMKAAAQAL